MTCYWYLSSIFYPFWFIVDILPIVDHGKLEAKRVCDHHRSEQEKKKHCQRHDRHEGWIHLAKVTSWGHITSSSTNLDHISSSESGLKASTKILNQTSASLSLNLNFKILTKPTFRISTRIVLHNLYNTSAAKCWTNSSFKILPELQLQNHDQPLCSKSEQKFSFMTKSKWPNLK